MYRMKTATVRDLRSDFDRISKWIEEGETVQIVKKGKPFARLAPEPRPGRLLGSMIGTGKVPPDIEKPADVEWDAMK